MPTPTSLRIPDRVKRGLDRAAEQQGEPAATLAIRLIDEGLRMADHPGIAFHDSPRHGRVAHVVRGPDVGEVIGVLTGLEAQGEARISETATWFGLHPSLVRAAVGYYAAFRDEIDAEIRARDAAAAEAHGRYEVEQAVLE